MTFDARNAGNFRSSAVWSTMPGRYCISILFSTMRKIRRTARFLVLHDPRTGERTVCLMSIVNKEKATASNHLPVGGRYSWFLGSIIVVTSHSSISSVLACWGVLRDTSDSPFPDSYYKQIWRNINPQWCSKFKQKLWLFYALILSSACATIKKVSGIATHFLFAC